ncbi:MAG: rhodanese-like domain-containing protein [Anaerolineae bacterium]
MLSSLFGKSSGPRPGEVSAKETVDKMAATPAPFVLDVRESYEYQAGHIKGAKLIPLGQLQKRVKELPTDGEIIVVCQSGSRSSSATSFLRKSGLNALNMNGGMSAWMRAGLPVERG